MKEQLRNGNARLRKKRELLKRKKDNVLIGEILMRKLTFELLLNKNFSRGNALAGMTVEHDLENFGEGRDVIMTLKDSKILDEEAGKSEGDTLVNVNMVDEERAKVSEKLNFIISYNLKVKFMSDLILFVILFSNT